MGVTQSPSVSRRLSGGVSLRCWAAEGGFGLALARRGHVFGHVRVATHVPNDPIQARASSMSVRGRTIRTPSPERKCRTLCVTRSRAPAPIAAARMGMSFGSASSRARSPSRDVGRWISFARPRRQVNDLDNL